MKTVIAKLLVGLGFLSVSFQASSQGAASDFPSRPITLIVPFTPGGSTDIVARVVSYKVGEILKQSVIVDNKAGANTLVGTLAAKRAAPDGYTIVIATNGHTSNPLLSKQPSYDPIKDFVPVILIGSTPNLIGINKNVPAHSLKELEAVSRKQKNGLMFATAGTGTAQHLTGELLKQQSKIKMEHVPYKGGIPAATDVVSGHVPILITALPASLPFVKSGDLRPIAVTSLKRSPIMPDVPTVAESGYPGFDTGYWLSIMAPAGTPKSIVVQLNDAFNKALKTEQVKMKMVEQGIDLTGGTPQELNDFVKADIESLRKVIATSGIEMTN